MKRWQRWGVQGVLGLGCWLAGTTGVWGQTTNWTNASGGLWFTSSNWSNGVPVNGINSVASFGTVTGSYTVGLDSGAAIGTLRVTDGNMTLSLSGSILTPQSAEIGTGAFLNGRLTVQNGVVNNAASLEIGNANLSTGVLTVSTGAVWNSLGVASDIGFSGSGTLNVINGGKFTSNNTLLGNTVGGVGTLSVTGAGSSASTTTLYVGNVGTGTTTVSASATMTTSGIVVGNQTNSTGTLTITGTGSSLQTSGILSVAVANFTTGSVVVSNGGILTSTFAGNNSIGGSTAGVSSNATVTVTGAGSTWTASSVLIGNFSNGTLNITSGGAVNLGSLILGSQSGSAGTVLVTGTNSSLTTSNTTIGNSGTGTMTVGTGAVVTTSTTTLVTASQGTLILDGGTLDTRNFTNNGTFNFNDGTLIVRNGTYTPSAALAQLFINGNDTAASPVLRLIGNATVSNISNLTVGNTRRGTLLMESGRTMALGSQNINIGSLAGSTGVITLTGGDTSLSNTNGLYVGGSNAGPGGQGTLNINIGTTVSTGTLMLYPQGTINLNHGTLNANSITAEGAFNFNGGTFNLTATTTTFNQTEVDTLLGAGHLLGNGKTLSFNNSLTLNTPLTIQGGTLSTGTSLINNQSLTVTDGQLNVTTTLTNSASKVLQVSGTGSVRATTAITNNGTILLNDNLVPTSGGTLTNTGTIRGTGYVGNNLTNNAAGQVQVTTGNRLEFQGTTNTNSGLISMLGGELVLTGPITNAASTGLISGRDAILRTGGITNNGSLAFSNGSMDVFGDITQNIGGRITISGGGTANFYDDVTIASGASSVQASSAGGTVAKVVFFGSYNGGVTGGGTAFIEGDHRPGNSPGLVTFGGDVFYGSLSKLFVELGGNNRGTQYDAIDVTGSVTLSGSLSLAQINSFIPSGGSSYLIINNDGTDPINGTFAGLAEGATFLASGNLYQVSYVGGTGNDFVISAVPEPSTWALLGLTVAGVGYAWNRRRRLKQGLWEADVEQKA